VKPGWFLHDLFEGVQGTPFRNFLILFSVGTGVFAMTILFAILEGLEERTRDLQRQIGAREIWVQAHQNGSPFLQQTDLNTLQSLFPGAELSGVRNGTPVFAPKGKKVIPVGGHPAMGNIRGWELASGRHLDPWDREHDTASVVIGPGLANTLNAQPGARIVMGRETVTVVGVTKSPLLLPQSSSQGLDRIWVSMGSPLIQTELSPRYEGILLQPPQDVDPERIATRLMADWARAWPDAEWQVLTSDRLLEGARRLSRTVRWVYGSISILCLLLGGVTLGSLMTLGVKQRQREIGLRLAIGATPAQVCGMFLVEGLTMTLLSAIIGIGFSWLMVTSRAHSIELPMIWDPATWLPSLMIVFLLGILCSLGPALLASRTAPAEAMRAE